MTPRPIDDVNMSVRVDRGEADVALLAETLMGARKREPRFWVSAQPAAPSERPSSTASQELRLAVAQLLATGVLRAIVDDGAGERRVLRDGRRAEGHAWSDALVDVSDPTFAQFSPLAFDWLWAVVHVALPLSERRARSTTTQPPNLSREERRQLGVTVPAACVTAFDDVFCVLAHEKLERLRLAEPIAAFLGRGLLASSPLLRLLAPHDAVDVDLAPSSLAALVRTPGHARLLELFGPRLARSWVAAVRGVWRTGEREGFVARCESVRATLAAYVDAVDAAGRLDLAAPVAAFVVQLPTVVPKDARERLVRLPGVVTMADRDVVVGALAGVVDVAGVVDAVDARLHAERYGDERYEEAQLWKAGLLACGYRAGREAVAVCARQLSGAVG